MIYAPEGIMRLRPVRLIDFLNDDYYLENIY